jgi:hypothetical protein
MRLKEELKNLFVDKERDLAVDAQLQRLQDGQDEINARLNQIQSDLKENSRALATLAIIQARLLNEISDLLSQKEKKKPATTKKSSGPEFTN